MEVGNICELVRRGTVDGKIHLSESCIWDPRRERSKTLERCCRFPEKFGLPIVPSKLDNGLLELAKRLARDFRSLR